MLILNVNPTRMELTRLKGRLRTAVRGHKLLKDKRDELMKQFIDIVRENRLLRTKVEKNLDLANQAFSVAGAIMSPEMLEQALMYPRTTVSLDMSFRNIMSVNVPVYQFQTMADTEETRGVTLSYGFASTSGELDGAIAVLAEVFQDMLKLAEQEKTAQLLAQEIERTRRRVNALEYVKIPQMQETIKYISMKLDENERSSTIRLMKVKDMILKEAIEDRRNKTYAAVAN